MYFCLVSSTFKFSYNALVLIGVIRQDLIAMPMIGDAKSIRMLILEGGDEGATSDDDCDTSIDGILDDFWEIDEDCRAIESIRKHIHSSDTWN
jgi:hypothetical protein